MDIKCSCLGNLVGGCIWKTPYGDKARRAQHKRPPLTLLSELLGKNRCLDGARYTIVSSTSLVYRIEMCTTNPPAIITVRT